MTQLSCALPANRSILRHLARIALQTRQFASSSDNKARGAPAAPPPTPTTASLRGILSHSPPPFVASYTPRDLLLYNLAIGAGAEDVESDLELTWEASPGGKFRVVPTWTTCPAYRARAHLSESFKEVFGSAPNVLLSQKIDVLSRIPIGQTLDTAISLENRLTVPNIYTTSNGKHSIIEARVETLQGNNLVAVNVARVMLMNRTFVEALDKRTPVELSQVKKATTTSAEPKRKTYTIPQNGAALFRLALGDANLIHIDPEFCRKAGFRGPLLHGVCTMGYGVRTSVKLLGLEMDSIKTVEAVFRAPVFMGDRITVECWDREGSGGYVPFRVVVGEGAEGKVAIEGAMEV